MNDKEFEKENIRAEFSEFLSLKQKEKSETLVSRVMSAGIENQTNILAKGESQNESAMISSVATLEKPEDRVNVSGENYLGVVANDSNISENISNEEDAAVKIQSIVRRKQSTATVDALKAAKKDAIDSLIAERDVHENLSILSSTSAALTRM